MPDGIDPLFQVHFLNAKGKQYAEDLATGFTALLRQVEGVAQDGRDLAIVRTKLQEASFFAKRAMALNPANQE